MALWEESRGNAREDIIRMWAKMRYTGCVELLVKVLKEQDAFWGKQELKAGWRRDETNPDLTKARQEFANLVYYSAYALGEIGDPRGREVLELTRARWAGESFEGKQIVEQCDAGLKGMGRQR